MTISLKAFDLFMVPRNTKNRIHALLCVQTCEYIHTCVLVYMEARGQFLLSSLNL